MNDEDIQHARGERGKADAPSVKAAEALGRLFEAMLLIRRVEERIIAQYSAQNEALARGEQPANAIRCPTHLSIGQEAAAVGVCSALRRDDTAFSTHRCHAHYLAKGGSVSRMMAELFGKASGCAGGKGGSMHLVDTGVGMLGASAIVGGSIPLALGAALSYQLRAEPRVAVAFFGDGAVEQGVFHEAMNIAALRKLPVVLACENNFYATLSHVSTRQTLPIAERAKSYGIPGIAVDGDDVRVVAEVARGAVDRARGGAGPTLLEIRAYRWMSHVGTEHDTGKMRRSLAELDAWRARCPIERARRELAREGFSEEALRVVEDRVRDIVEEAVRFAKEASEPATADLFRHVGARLQA
jgi:acetoin:2,6-dichlorophenolindophenol oxidoreductase subunit alpha